MLLNYINLNSIFRGSSLSLIQLLKRIYFLVTIVTKANATVTASANPTALPIIKSLTKEINSVYQYMNRNTYS